MYAQFMPKVMHGLLAMTGKKIVKLFDVLPNMKHEVQTIFPADWKLKVFWDLWYIVH